MLPEGSSCREKNFPLSIIRWLGVTQISSTYLHILYVNNVAGVPTVIVCMFIDEKY